MLNKDLKKRIIDIAYKNKLSHIGSYLSCVDVMDFIFAKKNPEDIFILSNGHASLAQYVILEKYHKHDAEMLFKKHGGHPHLDEESHIYCSTGSLGMGIAAAVGRALANPNRNVYVMLSDGECAEGIVWESLNFITDQKIKNIKLYFIHNGYGAYREIPFESFHRRIGAFGDIDGLINIFNEAKEPVEEFPFLKGLNAHYHVMKEDDYKIAMEILS